MTRRANLTGISIRASGRSAGTQTYPRAANSISFPPDPRDDLSARALLERGYVAEALINSATVLFCFLTFISVTLSVPLAVTLLLIAKLHY